MFLLIYPVVNLGFFGGGTGWFSDYHFRVVRSSGDFKPVAGVFSSNADKSKAYAEGRRISRDRGYPDINTMIAEEQKLDDGFTALTVIGRNDCHAPAGIAAFNAGKHVFMEKPIAETWDQAQRLMNAYGASSGVSVVAYTYTGYPMVKLARKLVQDGEIGDVIKVVARYKQGWLSDGVKNWRDNVGETCCLGDIGTHAYQFVRYVAGLNAKEVQYAKFRTLDGVRPDPTNKPDRPLEDNFTAELLLNNGRGAIAEIAASQIEKGAENDTEFEIIGTKGKLVWSMKDFSRLYHYDFNGELKAVHRDGIDAKLPDAVKPYTLLPTRHPEAHYGAMMNHYADWYRLINGEKPTIHAPSMEDGFAGMAFVKAALDFRNQGNNKPVGVDSVPLVDNSI